MDISPIPTYIVNIPTQVERKENILKQFNNKPQFDINFIDAELDPIGAVGLWKSIVKTIRIAQEQNHDKILFCEDDHFFTSTYTFDFLLKNLKIANEKGADLLIGGVSGFGSTIPVDKNLYLVDWYWGNQFLIIDKCLFQPIIDYKFENTNNADGVLSSIAKTKLIIYPFISAQKEFGYSNIEPKNAQKGFVNNLFVKAIERFNGIHKLNLLYNYENKK